MSIDYSNVENGLSKAEKNGFFFQDSLSLEKTCDFAGYPAENKGILVVESPRFRRLIV
jgi:hypothetical protein